MNYRTLYATVAYKWGLPHWIWLYLPPLSTSSKFLTTPSGFIIVLQSIVWIAIRFVSAPFIKTDRPILRVDILLSFPTDNLRFCYIIFHWCIVIREVNPSILVQKKFDKMSKLSEKIRYKVDNVCSTNDGNVIHDCNQKSLLLYGYIQKCQCWRSLY